MCLENHWGHGVEEEAREVYWRSYELGDFHLVPPPSKEQKWAEPSAENFTTVNNSISEQKWDLWESLTEFFFRG